MTAPTDAPALRRGHGSTYRVTHPQIAADGHAFNCGRCSRPSSISGRKRHRIYGYVCVGCAGGLGLLK